MGGGGEKINYSPMTPKIFTRAREKTSLEYRYIFFEIRNSDKFVIWQREKRGEREREREKERERRERKKRERFALKERKLQLLFKSP